MRITDRVKIGGIKYRVKSKSLIANNPDCDGQITYSGQLIELRSDMDKHSDYAKGVFLHEILRGIFEHCGIEQDENIVNRLAAALYMTMKDNPNIFKEDSDGMQ